MNNLTYSEIMMLYENHEYVEIKNETLCIQLPSRLGTIIGSIAAFIFMFFGLAGNILIIVAILRSPKLRSNLVNIFVIR